MFLILFRNILCPQQMFPSLRAQGNVMSNNVSATMCPRFRWTDFITDSADACILVMACADCARAPKNPFEPP